MKKTFFLSLLLCWVASCSTPPTQAGRTPDRVALILDTDLGPDYDDVGAMAVLHALADSGYVDILAVLACNQHPMVIPCIDVLNTWFGRPAIPLGAPKSTGAPDLTSRHTVKWTEYLPAHYPHRVKATAEAPDAVEVYRKVLSEAADSSVVICSIGFFTNLAGLLASEGDRYSPLNGKELVARKVKRLVSMAGRFPAGREYNVYIDAPAAIRTIHNWPTEILFSGFEIGKEILTGLSVSKMEGENNPVKDTFRLCLAEGDFDGRMSWDQTAVLVAVKGYDPYYTVERGVCRIAEDGSNTWEPDPEGGHLRLIEKMDKNRVTELIEKYMRHQPLK
ncbi:MAG: nucleoside hydrolase [Tannerellaceae bacterium]|nr:nucleoside hydrolase [Tannerellaceae bacterium]